MNFLDKNGFRAALVIAVIFLAMPFMFPERVPVNDKGNAEDSAQPVKSKKFITGVYERIGNFYGFKKTKKSALDQALEKLKTEADGAAADKKDGQAGAQNSFDKAAASADSSSAGAEAGGSSFDTGSASSKMSFSAAAARASAKPRLSIGGKEYEVVKDLYGKDYAITGKGPVAVSSLLAKGGVLKYPSGKTVSNARVSSEAYNPGGGANPYASLTASSKSSGGSYKGSKRSGGVASTRKISSGFSLSGSGGGSRKVSRKGSGARGSFGDFTGAVDIEEAYNNVQSQALAVKNVQQANAFEEQYTYYEAPSSAPSANVALSAAISPALLQGESMFESGTQASAAKETEYTKVSKSEKSKVSLSLTETPAAAPEVKSTPKADSNKIEVDISLNSGSGVIPKDKDLLKSMTKQLLGENVVFESLPSGSKESIPNPWIFPTDVPKKDFSLAFWEENKVALANAKKNKDNKSYSDPGIWKESDTANNEVSTYIKSKKIPVKVIVLDGAGTGSQKNYFQQMANYITGNNHTPKADANTIYVYKNESDIEGVKSVNLVPHSMMITPEDNIAFGTKIQAQVEAMEKTANGKASKDVLKEANKEETKRVKKDVRQFGEEISQSKP